MGIMKKLNKTALKWTILAIALLQMGGMGLSPSLPILKPPQQSYLSELTALYMSGSRAGGC